MGASRFRLRASPLRSVPPLWALCALWLIILALAPSSAEAQQRVVYKKGLFHQRGKVLTLTVGFREMFDRKLRKRLRNGFATTVVMRVYLFEQKGERNVAFSARTLKAVYDLWDERYRVQMDEPGRTRFRRSRSQRYVVNRLTSVWRFPIANLSSVTKNKPYFVAIIAEVNPISDALLAEVRRWLRNPRRHSRIGESSFFGSFVSIFINNKIRRAEKTFRLRTQPFIVPK